jgi:uncharacterized protein HemX
VRDAADFLPSANFSATARPSDAPNASSSSGLAIGLGIAAAVVAIAVVVLGVLWWRAHRTAETSAVEAIETQASDTTATFFEYSTFANPELMLIGLFETAVGDQNPWE